MAALMISRFRFDGPEADVQGWLDALAGLRRQAGCTYARIFRHETEPDTYVSVFEFPSVESARHYLNASTVELGGDILSQVYEWKIDFYDRALDEDARPRLTA